MNHVVLVRHNSYLYKGIVEDNLRMACPDATKQELEDALEKVNLLGFLNTQDGINTKLLEKASNLSGGQCQRLAIARALLYLNRHKTYLHLHLSFTVHTSCNSLPAQELICKHYK